MKVTFWVSTITMIEGAVMATLLGAWLDWPWWVRVVASLLIGHFLQIAVSVAMLFAYVQTFLDGMSAARRAKGG